MPLPTTPPRSPFFLLFLIIRQEIKSYLTAPFSYLVAASYLIFSGVLGIYAGNFFEREQADLLPFFTFHPYLHLLLIAALSMRLWADERALRSLELTLSMPVPLWVWVLGKNIGLAIFFSLVLLMTFPQWLTAEALGNPDRDLILSGYLGSFLLALAMISLGSYCSSLTRTQTIAFVWMLSLGFLFLCTQFDAVQETLGFLPTWLKDTLYEMSLLKHFIQFTEGVVGLDDIVYFVLFSATFSVLTMITLELKK